MAVRLIDLFDHGALGEAIGAGLVRPQQHPTEPLTILNYSNACQFARAWTPVTRTCRGLIVHRATGEIVARPYPKFFGHDDPMAGSLPVDEPCVVTDKLDGCLGILYPVPSGGFAVATRGSFDSIPARHATQVWNARYAGRWAPPLGMTALVEVIYAGWRIVLDYGDLDDLVLHGFVDNATGRTYSPEGVNFGWPGPVATVYPYGSLPEALAAEPRPGAEGLVVHFTESDIRVKLKQADYLALHRLMFHLTARRLWTHLAVQARADVIREPKQWATFLRIDPADAAGALAAGPDWYDDLIREVPDEFYGWMNQRIAEINSTVGRTRYEIAQALEWFGPQYAGNRLALLAALEGHPLRTPLTLALDGRVQYVENWVWRQAKPPHEIPFRAINEDVA